MVAKHWNRLPKEAVKPPYLELFKANCSGQHAPVGPALGRKLWLDHLQRYFLLPALL